MNRDRRSVLRAVGGSAGLAALAGCVSFSGGGSESDGGEPTSSKESMSDDESTPVSGSASVWTNRQGAEVDSIKTQIDAFESESPHEIDHQNITKDLKKKTKTALAAGDGPASFGWAHDWTGEFYANDLLSDQRDAISVSLDTFTGTAQEAAQYKGDLIGLPFSSETVGLIANTDIVDTVPETLAEMQSIMDDYHDPENGQYGLSYPLNGYFYSAWAHAFDGYYYDQETAELGLTEQSTLDGFRTVIDGLYPYMPDDPAYGAQTSPFKNGDAAFAINGPWFTGSLEVPYEVAKLPSVDGNEPSPYTGISLWYFTARAEGATGAASRAFAEWYTTDEELHRKLAQEFGFVPVLQSLEGSDELPAEVRAFAANVTAGRPIPTDPKMNQVWGPTETAFSDALSGKRELESAMADAEETIKSDWE